METEEEEERKNVTKKELQSSPYDKRSALIVREMIERIGSSLLPTTVSWNERKRHRDDNASISDICQKAVVSCGVHCGGGGGEFGKNRFGCHVTRKKVLLYKTCDCYVIINHRKYDSNNISYFSSIIFHSG